MISSENPEELTKPDRLSEYAALLSDVSTLIAELELNQISDRAAHTFSFELIGEHQVVIPEGIITVMPEIDQITASITKEGMDDPSMLSINLFSDSKVVMITRSGQDEETQAPEVLIDTSFHTREDGRSPKDAKRQIQTEDSEDFEKRLETVARISNPELNSFIMSLIYPDKDRGYEMFAHADFLNPSAYESLKDSFRLSALNNGSSITYKFETSESQMSYTKQEGQPTSFTLRYADQKDGHLATVYINMDADFQLQFREACEITRLSGVVTDEMMSFSPTTKELQHIRSILLTEIQSIHPTPVAFMEDEYVENKDPETLLIERKTIVLRREYVKKVLDELNFHAPETGEFL